MHHRLALALAAFVLTGCHPGEPATPPLLRETLARPAWQAPGTVPGRSFQIPHTALVTRNGIPGVYVIGENNLARFRMIKVGKRHGDMIEIISGLFGDEVLVMGDLTAVLDGSPIQVASDATTQ